MDGWMDIPFSHGLVRLQRQWSILKCKTCHGILQGSRLECIDILNDSLNNWQIFNFTKSFYSKIVIRHRCRILSFMKRLTWLQFPPAQIMLSVHIMPSCNITKTVGWTQNVRPHFSALTLRLIVLTSGILRWHFYISLNIRFGNPTKS